MTSLSPTPITDLASLPWYLRASMYPFGIAFCLFIVYSGIGGLCNYGTTNIMFNNGVYGSTIFNILTVAAGLTILTGLVKRMKGVEIFGLVNCIALMLVRILVTIGVAGFDPVLINLAMFTLLFSSASACRVFTIVASRKHNIPIL